LHWYSGDPHLVERFVELGCYFSVNSRTALECIERVPASRVLTETDFPATRRHGGHLPGATASAVDRIAEVYSEPTSVVERRIWENFAGACQTAGLVCPADWPSPPAEGAHERTLF
jgi:TatD DNase family protein